MDKVRETIAQSHARSNGANATTVVDYLYADALIRELAAIGVVQLDENQVPNCSYPGGVRKSCAAGFCKVQPLEAEKK